MFAAEIGGVDAALAIQAARDLPFLSVRLAPHETRGLTNEAPAEVEQLLHWLDADRGYGVALWQMSDGRVVALRRVGGVSGWVDEGTALEMLPIAPAVVVDNPGPLKVAVRMWRQGLVLLLKPPETLSTPQPTSLEEACGALADQTARTASAARHLIVTTAPPGHISALAAQVGPLGLRALVHPSMQGPSGTTWSLSYQDSETIDVREAPDTEPDAYWGKSTVEARIRLSPEAEAVSRVRSAIEEMTIRSWLAP
jgi:hypothetical protein